MGILSARGDARKALPVVTESDCKGCGACCRHVGHPMFMRWVDEHGKEHSEDPYWLALPEPLKRRHRLYMRLLEESGIGDDYGLPCYWLEPDGTCRHYEYRPDCCRDFEMGEERCLWFRRKHRIRARSCSRE
jgi:Fe-S-cluster containining protein